MGSAGCDKTTLLERAIPELRRTLSVGVLEGDLATTKDAARIGALGVPVVQLLTEGDDKPAKYPFLFKASDLVVITKLDLLDATDFSVERASADIHALDVRKTIVPISAKDASSTRRVVDWLSAAG